MLRSLRREHDLAAIGRRSWSELTARHQQAGANWIRRTGLEVRPAHVFDCPGVMAALCAVLGAMTHPGDQVLTGELSHPLVKMLADQYSLKIHGLAMDDDGIDPEAFATVCLYRERTAPGGPASGAGTDRPPARRAAIDGASRGLIRRRRDVDSGEQVIIVTKKSPSRRESSNVVKKRFFKTKQEVEVAFEIEPVDAEQVELLCEANGWEPVEMKRNKKGAFRAKMRLPREKRFQFRYLVNRTTWLNDESADAYCRNEFGGENSVLDTTPAG